MYRLNEQARKLTWADWKLCGGCDIDKELSHSVAVEMVVSVDKWLRSGITLGQIADINVMAEKDIARYAVERMNRQEWSDVRWQK